MVRIRSMLALALVLAPLAAPAVAHVHPDAELQALHDADQADRKVLEDLAPSQWSGAMQGLRERDAARRARVRELLDAARPVRGRGWYHAAMVFQHGDAAADAMLAHQLASLAAFNGIEEARWLAAASLDRYLQRVQQPQVFGTQYFQLEREPWTMEPYDRTTPAAVREAYRVPPLAETERRLEELNADRRPTP